MNDRNELGLASLRLAMTRKWLSSNGYSSQIAALELFDNLAGYLVRQEGVDDELEAHLRKHQEGSWAICRNSISVMLDEDFDSLGIPPRCPYDMDQLLLML